MTVWQKISGLATAVSDAGGNLLEGLGRALGIGGEGEPQKDVAFTIAVVALSAKMASVDGIASALEYKAFAEVFRSAPEEADNVERIFNLAKQDVAGYQAYAEQIARLLKDDRKLLQHVLEGLMYVAAADESLHPREDAFLEEVATRFGFSDSEFRFFRARFVKDHDNPYDALRLTPEATDTEIKAQYRKLVRDNHPDRLMANGVAPEFIDLANRKLAAINAAYETIARERGL
jgi:DnaJ like chaperone protein